jgi:putative transposase
MRQGALGAGSSGTHPPTHGAACGQTWDKRYLEEGRRTINKARHCLWRAVDQGGNSLDILVQGRCDQAAAKKFFRKLLTGLTSVPRGIITDQLKSDSAAKREVWPSVEHRQHRYLNNRAEDSPQPTRQRERRMPQVNSPGHAPFIK